MKKKEEEKEGEAELTDAQVVIVMEAGVQTDDASGLPAVKQEVKEEATEETAGAEPAEVKPEEPAVAESEQPSAPEKEIQKDEGAAMEPLPVQPRSPTSPAMEVEKEETEAPEAKKAVPTEAATTTSAAEKKDEAMIADNADRNMDKAEGPASPTAAAAPEVFPERVPPPKERYRHKKRRNETPESRSERKLLKARERKERKAAEAEARSSAGWRSWHWAEIPRKTRVQKRAALQPADETVPARAQGQTGPAVKKSCRRCCCLRFVRAHLGVIQLYH